MLAEAIKKQCEFCASYANASPEVIAKLAESNDYNAYIRLCHYERQLDAAESVSRTNEIIKRHRLDHSTIRQCDAQFSP
jgi:hypothetical protein